MQKPNQGILALPAVTQEAGFVASAAALVGGSAYSVATGLLLAELYVNTARDPTTGDDGGGGSSGSAAFATIARGTIGQGGILVGATAYVFLHVALLVAYISKSAEIIDHATGLGVLPGALAFTLAFGGLCYSASAPQLDRVNGALVALIILSFFGLLGSAAGAVEPSALLRADWGAVPATLPVIALSFVYHNTVPVICASLRGDPGKIRAAIIGGISVPLVMFVAWNGAILGSLGTLSSSSSGGAGQAISLAATNSSSSSSSRSSTSAVSAAAAAAPPPPLSTAPAPAAAAAAPAKQRRVEDPLAALAAADPTVGVEINAFSFLAVATSFIGFILGLTDFISGALGLPSRQAPLPYLLTLVPPLVLAVAFPGIFLSAIDTAGGVAGWEGGSCCCRGGRVVGGIVKKIAAHCSADDHS